jgi:hypothetical protein
MRHHEVKWIKKNLIKEGWFIYFIIVYWLDPWCQVVILCIEFNPYTVTFGLL